MTRLATDPTGVSIQRRWQIKQAAKGLCTCCGKRPRVTVNHCEVCRTKNNDRTAARRYDRGAVMVPNRQRCSKCGERGHNRKHWKHRNETTQQGATT